MQNQKHEIVSLNNKLHDTQQRANEITAQNAHTIVQITEAKASKKKVELATKQIKKKYNDSFQELTNHEKEIRSLQSQLQELNNLISGVVKDTNERQSELSKQEHSLQNYKEDQMIYVGQLVKKGLELNVNQTNI